MFGLIGKMVTTPGKRDEFAAILLGGTGGMPGCLSYIVAKDPRDADALWITEVWDSSESHKASLKLPGVQAAIAKGRPLIASFGDQVQTEPIGGVGLLKPWCTDVSARSGSPTQCADRMRTRSGCSDRR